MDTAIATSDGGYLLLGSSQSLFFTALKVFNPSKPPRPFTVKINSSGDPQWASTVDRGINFLSDVVQTRDGGYVFVGAAPLITNKDKNPNVEIAMIKMSSNGEQVWANRYDLGSFSAGYRLIEQRDGSLIISGYTRQIAGDIDALILKTDSNGNPLWTKVYLTERDQWPLSLVEASQGGFLTAGLSRRGETGHDLFASRISPTGNLIWSKTYEGSKSLEALNIMEGYHGDFLILGRLGSLNENKQTATAMLIDIEGKIVAMTVLGNYTALYSAAKLQNEKYRLMGETADFQAAYADILTITLTPESTGKLAGEENGFSPRSLKTQEQDVQLKAEPIKLQYRLLPLGLLEVQALSVGEDIKDIPKAP